MQHIISLPMDNGESQFAICSSLFSILKITCRFCNYEHYHLYKDKKYAELQKEIRNAVNPARVIAMICDVNQLDGHCRSNHLGPCWGGSDIYHLPSSRRADLIRSIYSC
jgi:hypothetical protein